MYDTYQIKGDNMELVKITQNIDFITLRNQWFDIMSRAEVCSINLWSIQIMGFQLVA